MITRNQANEVADDLLAIERARNAKSPRRGPGDLVNSFSELERFAPARRRAAIHAAMDWADRQWAVIGACLLWIALAICVPVFVLPEHWSDAIVPGVIVLAIPFILLRRAYVRRYLVALLRAPEDEREAALGG
jgi:hypothetical protein